MSPAPLLTFPASPAFLRRLVMALLSATLVLFLAGSAFATIDGPRPGVSDAFTSGVWQPDELPDVAILVSGDGPGGSAIVADGIVQAEIERVAIPAIRDLDGVAAVVTELAPSDRLALHVSLTPDAPEGIVDSIAAAIDAEAPDATIAIGGRTVADRDLLDALNRGTIVAVVPVILLVSVLIAAAMGVRLGLAAGGTIALSSLLGGIIGARIAGPFDGSLGTTAVPAVLVAVLVSSVLTFRLLDLFKIERSDDPAELIRRAVKHLAPEAALLFGGIIATALILEMVGSSRAPASVVAVGGFFGALVTLGGLPGVLAALPPVPDDDAYRLFKVNVPDGRDVSLAVLAGFTCFLLGLGLFAIRMPSIDLLDESDLSSGSMSRRVSEQLIELGGDPSSAILAELPADIDDRSVANWAKEASLVSGVGWVETATGRYVQGELVSAPVSEATFRRGEGTAAIVTTNLTARSASAQALVTTLESTGGDGVEIELSGPAVDARAVAESGQNHLLPLVLLLAVAGGLSVLALVGDSALALLTALLRIIGTAALLGVYHLVSGGVTGAELQVAALILSVGVGLFEIGFLRRISRDLEAADRSDDPDSEAHRQGRSEIVGRAFRQEGRAAMLGLGITALCGIGFLSSDLEIARRMGLAIAAGLVIELLIGTWMLRPAVLGERALGLSLLGRTGRSGPALRPAIAAIEADRVDPESVPVATASDLELLRSGAVPQPERDDAAPPMAAVTGQEPDEQEQAVQERDENEGEMDTETTSDATQPPPPTRSALIELDDTDPSSWRAAFVRIAARAGALASARDVEEMAKLDAQSADERGRDLVGSAEPGPSRDPLLFGDELTAELEESEATSAGMDPEWRRIVAQLLRSEFSFQTDPNEAELETVFVDGTPLFGELTEHNRRLRRAGLRVTGHGPRVIKITVVNDGSPVTLAVTVDHPARQLLDRDGRLLGTREPERREGLLWLVREPSGRYRIAEAVDLGVVAPISFEGPIELTGVTPEQSVPIDEVTDAEGNVAR